MLNLAFVWHMHQPFYRDLFSGEYVLPWVRLHGIKDYLDMARILDSFPRLHQNFNFSPVLLEQIQEYANGGMEKDYYWQLSLKPPEALSLAEREFVWKNFFMANLENLIKPHPRYYELYLKRQKDEPLSTEETRDLQVWFNLAWVDPSLQKASRRITSLIEKDRNYTEEDKRTVLSYQLEIVSRIIPTYKRLQEEGRIEISISPYYHPILPLIHDVRQACQEANPTTTPPDEEFSYAQDVSWHIQEAVRACKKFFGRTPSGMWPSELAVNEQILKFVVRERLKWLVLDEGLLFKSTGVQNKDAIYRGYSLKVQGDRLNVVFRDQYLSDLISFTYYHWDAQRAVSDFMRYAEAVALRMRRQEALLVIAMDGENAWEFYPNDGRDFLLLLYKKLSAHPQIRCVTVQEYLSRNRRGLRPLAHLAAGSWVRRDFSKWVGGPLKNQAWLELAQARSVLECEASLFSEKVYRLALRQLYILEGSDWFWWYDDIALPNEFDNLFKRHLDNFYGIIRDSSL